MRSYCSACMVAGLAVSVLFLACYLFYHSRVGSVPFRRPGPIRLVYLSILLSHTVLAAAVVPLVVLTLVRAVRRQFDRHARIARVTFPIWLDSTLSVLAPAHAANTRSVFARSTSMIDG